jgi:hypothetical protein
MRNRICLVIAVATIMIGFVSCQKSDVFQSASVNNYLSLSTGKYIIYQLDSTVKRPFDDTGFVVHSYQAKDMVDAPVTDNLGRPSWRVVRYLRPLNSKDESEWRPISSMLYTIVNAGTSSETLEVVENNMRFQKLKRPVKDGFNWKGNAYIFTQATSDVYYLDDWDYTYEEIDQPYLSFGKTIDSTITVHQQDDGGDTARVSGGYSEANYSVEVYARNIGLVGKDFLHRAYQLSSNQFPNGYSEGYGLKLRMISHN